METGKTPRILSSASSRKPNYGGRGGTARGILTRPPAPACAAPAPGLTTVLELVSLPASLAAALQSTISFQQHGRQAADSRSLGGALPHQPAI